MNKVKYTGWIPRFNNDVTAFGTPKFRKPTPPPPPKGLLSSPRRCLVDNKPCLFHRWVDEDEGFLKINAFVRPDELIDLVRSFRHDHFIKPGCEVEKLRKTFALVEYPDGSVGKVDPSLVTFLDKEVR